MGKTRQTRRIIRHKRNRSKSIWLDRPRGKSVELTRPKRTCNRRGQRLSLSTPLRNHRATGNHSRVVSPEPPIHADTTSTRNNGISTTHLDAISPHPDHLPSPLRPMSWNAGIEMTSARGKYSVQHLSSRSL